MNCEFGMGYTKGNSITLTSSTSANISSSSITGLLDVVVDLVVEGTVGRIDFLVVVAFEVKKDGCV